MARVLLVDDDRPSREALAELLGLYGDEVETAGTADEARRLIDRGGFDFDVVVTDVWLPGGSFSLLAHLRGRWPALPVIMMTADFETGLRDRALRRGAFALVEKPLTGLALHRLVERAGGSAEEVPVFAGGGPERTRSERRG